MGYVKNMKKIASIISDIRLININAKHVYLCSLPLMGQKVLQTEGYIIGGNKCQDTSTDSDARIVVMKSNQIEN